MTLIFWTFSDIIWYFQTLLGIFRHYQIFSDILLSKLWLRYFVDFQTLSGIFRNSIIQVMVYPSYGLLSKIFFTFSDNIKYFQTLSDIFRHSIIQVMTLSCILYIFRHSIILVCGTIYLFIVNLCHGYIFRFVLTSLKRCWSIYSRSSVPLAPLQHLFYSSEKWSAASKRVIDFFYLRFFQIIDKYVIDL